MTPYEKLANKAKLNNNQASVLFDVHLTTVQRWLNGEARVPKSVILCLRSINENKPVEI